MTEIKTPEDFKNCYIDLSNTELNGEMTEEVSKKLGFAMQKCFGKDYCENNITISEENNPFHNRRIVYIKPDNSFFDDIHCSSPEEQEIAKCQAKDEFPEYVLENYKEISVHDILGFDEEEEAKIITASNPRLNCNKVDQLLRGSIKKQIVIKSTKHHE